MRDRVILTFNRKEYPLLPAFSVMDSFEDRCGALTAHLISLTNGSATLRNRATLVYFAMKAAREEDGGSSADMSVQSVMVAMWEFGAADNDLMLKEVELIERLLYTPEQYRVKKEEREKAEQAQQAILDMMGASPSFSDSPPPFSDGNLPSSGARPQENSSPV